MNSAQDRLAYQAPAAHFLTGQAQHLLLLAVLVTGAWSLARPVLDDSQWLGITDRAWFTTSLVLAVIHQVLGWLVFRGQLCFHIFTRWFGKADMLVWGGLFLPFLAARPLLLIALALADAGSLALPRPLTSILGLLLLIPAIYTAWSVHKYFDLTRALGGDHFRESYRQMPFVRQGAFRWSSNAMYAFAFLALWAIALLGGSRAALAAALFQHAYIWVHMYCTEEPDIRLLYS